MAVDRILPVLRVPGVSDIVAFADGKVKLFGMNVEPDHWTVGKSLFEIAGRGRPAEFAGGDDFPGLGGDHPERTREDPGSATTSTS